MWWAVASVVLDAMSVRSVAMTLGCSWDCAERRGPGQGAGSVWSTTSIAGRGQRDRRGRARVAAHAPGLQVRDRGRGPDPALRRPARPSPGRGRGQERRGVRRMARLWSEGFRRNVRVVAMDAFAGYKEAVRRVVPHAREVLDPFHVVRLAGDRLTRCRQRLQQEATGRRGTKHDPLYKPDESCSRPAPPSR